jgi:hypothetical protein
VSCGRDSNDRSTGSGAPPTFTHGMASTGLCHCRSGALCVERREWREAEAWQWALEGQAGSFPGAGMADWGECRRGEGEVITIAGGGGDGRNHGIVVS